MKIMRKSLCDSANKEADGKCLGYSLEDDDEPVEDCKICKKYTSYSEDEE